MLLTAGKYTNVRQLARPAVQTARRCTPGAANLFIPSAAGRRLMLRDWYFRELKEGGWLYNYLHRERARTPQDVRRVARVMHGFQQNPRSDFRRLAAVPAKLYHRWKDEDQHFWEDDNNLRSLKRDNPDLPVYVPPRQLPTTRTVKRYAPA